MYTSCRWLLNGKWSMAAAERSFSLALSLFTFLQHHINCNGGDNDVHLVPVLCKLRRNGEIIFICSCKKFLGYSSPFFIDAANMLPVIARYSKIPRLPVTVDFSDLC